jgi:hypothetical protein
MVGVDWIHFAEGRNRRGDSYEQHNEPSGFIKDRDFLDQLRTLLISQEELCSMEFWLVNT